MAVLDLFSHRKRISEGKLPDVFNYDSLPKKLLVQIVHIWRDAIGPYYLSQGFSMSDPPHNNAGWHHIHDAVAREHGVFELGPE